MEYKQLETFPSELSLSDPEPQGQVGNPVDLVHQIRRLRAVGQTEEAQKQCMRLLQACEFLFQSIAWGFYHDLMLREDVLSAMRVQVLCEVCDPSERFLTKNFWHAVRCICFDITKRAMRGERRTLIGTENTRSQQWYMVRSAPTGISEDGGLEVLDVCDDSPRRKPGASQQTEVSRRLRPSQYVFALLNGKVALKLLKDLTERAQEHLYASIFTQGHDFPCNAQTLFGCVCTKTLFLAYQVGANMSMPIYPPLPYPPQKDSLLSLGLKSRVLRSV